jgi:hypothetical protein
VGRELLDEVVAAQIDGRGGDLAVGELAAELLGEGLEGALPPGQQQQIEAAGGEAAGVGGSEALRSPRHQGGGSVALAEVHDGHHNPGTSARRSWG